MNRPRLSSRPTPLRSGLDATRPASRCGWKKSALDWLWTPHRAFGVVSPCLDARPAGTRRRAKEEAMRSSKTLRVLRSGLAIAALVAGLSGSRAAAVDVRFVRIDGYPAPGTPPNLNKVGILEIGSATARNVLVLNPGTSASAAYFAPLAENIVDRLPRWQVWAVERREDPARGRCLPSTASDRQLTHPPPVPHHRAGVPA